MKREQELAELLADGLDLCVRARKIDGAVANAGNFTPTEMEPTRCGTPRMWVLEQYDKDLEAWEKRARERLIALGYAF